MLVDNFFFGNLMLFMCVDHVFYPFFGQKKIAKNKKIEYYIYV